MGCRARVVAMGPVDGPMLTPEQMIDVLLADPEHRERARARLAELDAAAVEGDLPRSEEPPRFDPME